MTTGRKEPFLPKKVTAFEIKEGMCGSDVLDVIRGKVAGENTSRMHEASLYLRDRYKDTDTPDKSKYRVIKVDSRQGMDYAIIRHNEYKNLNFIAGINDEGYYFVHMLWGMPREYMDDDIDRTLNWVNQTDEGFTERVQGDFLIRFIHLNTNLDNEDQAQVVTSASIGVERLSNRTKERREISDNLFFYTSYDRRYNFFNIRMFDEYRSGDTDITYYMDSIDTHDTPLKLGDHTIRTDIDWRGRARLVPFTYRQNDGTPPYVFITGKQFLMSHPEHGMKEVEIPEEYVALLTVQRGTHVRVEDYFWENRSGQSQAMSGGDD